MLMKNSQLKMFAVFYLQKLMFLNLNSTKLIKRQKQLGAKNWLKNILFYLLLCLTPFEQN